MKLVCIESPWAGLGGGREAALYLRRCIRDSLKRGELPLASHAVFCIAGGIDDNIPELRARGLSAAMRYILAADLVAVYVDHGISQGMKRALDFANANQKIIQARRIGNEDIRLDGATSFANW